MRPEASSCSAQVWSVLYYTELRATHTFYTRKGGATPGNLHLQSSTAVTQCLLIATHFNDSQKDDSLCQAWECYRELNLSRWHTATCSCGLYMHSWVYWLLFFIWKSNTLIRTFNHWDIQKDWYCLECDGSPDQCLAAIEVECQYKNSALAKSVLLYGRDVNETLGFETETRPLKNRSRDRLETKTLSPR